MPLPDDDSSASQAIVMAVTTLDDPQAAEIVGHGAR